MCFVPLSATSIVALYLGSRSQGVALAVDATICSARLLGWLFAKIFFFLSDHGYHLSFIIPNSTNSISMIWREKKRDSFPIRLMDVIHLTRGERDTDTNSLPHYSLPAFILGLHCFFLVFPLLIHSLKVFGCQRHNCVMMVYLRKENKSFRPVCAFLKSWYSTLLTHKGGVLWCCPNILFSGNLLQY